MLGGQPDHIDLDASCILFDANKNVVDVVYFGNLESRNGAVRHSGDNLTGEGEGDDEVIYVDLPNIPAVVNYIVFTVSSYRNQTFDQIANAFCRLVDATTSREIAHFDISGGGSHTGLIMTKLYRHNGEWKLQAVGEKLNSKTVEDLIAPVKNIL